MLSRSYPSQLDFTRGILRCALVSGMLGILFCAAAPHAAAQQTSEVPIDEVVANLAAGRVVIAVVKDAILIATLEDPIEAQTHPPAPAAISSRGAAVILGPVDWFSPSSQQGLARLDQELPHLRARIGPQAPHVQQSREGEEATEIEGIGEGVLQRLNAIVKDFHAKITLPAGEPFVELIVTDFLAGYGPEVWQVTYALKQSQQRGDYWDSRVLRPAYLQFWPPEKGQPHTLIEFHYPPRNPSMDLIELLRQKDPRLEKIRTADPKMAEVAQFLLAGQSGKILAADATQFLRAAIDAIAPPKARETMAAIGFERGFEWILPPPPEPKKPGQQKERPAGAPSLSKPTE